MAETPWTRWRPGILNKDQIKTLWEIGRIGGKLREEDIDHSSFDLHLGKDCWHMRGSLKLREDELFQPILTNGHFCVEELDLTKRTLLKPKSTYVIKLEEELQADGSGIKLNGIATGKSSIGRLDVLTRLISEKCSKYDSILQDPHTHLYVEVTPITLPIKVGVGDVLNQLRLFRGNPSISVLRREEYDLFGGLIFNPRKEIRQLSLSLEPVRICDRNVIAFTTKKRQFGDEEAVDVSSPPGSLDPSLYWEPVFADNAACNSILIEKDRFYILRSKERFQLPKDVGVYCRAITESLGEIRIHYAGFVHPGFGLERTDGKEGTPLIFEVRGHTVDAFLRNGELMAEVEFYRLSEEADCSVQSYGEQELQLSKYFRKWESFK